VSIWLYKSLDMFNKKLRQQIVELESLVEKARTYSDSSNFECPLCSELDPLTHVPVHYCSFHLHIAILERDGRNLKQSHAEQCADMTAEIQEAKAIVVEYRRLVDKMMLALMSKPLRLSKKDVEPLAALVSEFELRLQSEARKSKSGAAWLSKMDYLDKL